MGFELKIASFAGKKQRPGVVLVVMSLGESDVVSSSMRRNTAAFHAVGAVLVLSGGDS
ncbi:MAG: hypothetical protein QNJ75_05430 [Acidimicrobiia bacterium]|nr:hypothetical protein [Acidimicrobiia bacterium]